MSGLHIVFVWKTAVGWSALMGSLLTAVATFAVCYISCCCWRILGVWAKASGHIVAKRLSVKIFDKEVHAVFPSRPFKVFLVGGQVLC